MISACLSISICILVNLLLIALSGEFKQFFKSPTSIVKLVILSFLSVTNAQKERKEEIIELRCKLETQGDIMQKNMASFNDVLFKLAGNIDVLTIDETYDNRDETNKG